MVDAPATALMVYAVDDGGIAFRLAVKILLPAGPAVRVALTHPCLFKHTETPPDKIGTNPQTMARCGAAWRTIWSVCVVANRKPYCVAVAVVTAKRKL